MTIYRILLPACILSVIGTQAQTSVKLNLTEATVFLAGAQLSGTAHVHLNKGENDFIFTNVAGDINTQSLSINGGPGVVVESAVSKNDYLLQEDLSPLALSLKDSIKSLEGSKTALANKITVLNEQLSILQQNRKVSGDNSDLSVAELTKLLDLVNQKMEAILTQKSKTELSQKETDERLTKLRSQLDEERRKGYQPGGQLLVRLYAKEATTNDVRITYNISNAGWSPIYDIRVDDLAKPAQLYYKADVRQNSGISWNNVHLRLSTGNPTEGAQAPELSPWYLSFYVPRTIAANAPAKYKGANLALAGARAADAEYVINGETTMGEYVATDNAGVFTTFDIDLPYSVPNDGKPHQVALKNYELPASHRYFAIPKLDGDAFLQAQVTDWQNLNLIPGPSNVYYEGTFVGTGFVDTRNTSDTLTFSLGRDKKVVVKREQDEKLRTKRLIGSNTREQFAYTISVRNTRSNNIHIVIQDQIPVSQEKDISVDNVQIEPAILNEQTGELSWTIDVPSNKTELIHFGYTIIYPNGKTVNNLR